MCFLCMHGAIVIVIVVRRFVVCASVVCMVVDVCAFVVGVAVLVIVI